MKLTPMYLFLLLLLILVVLVIMGNNSCLAEGFVSFQKDKPNSPPYINIPQYGSKNVHKLFDSIYLDPYNTNLIEVDSAAFVGNVDLTGTSIQKLYVTPRATTSGTFLTSTYVLSSGSPSSQTTRDSLISGTMDSYISGKYTSFSGNTDSYVTFYIPYAQNTVIHMINMNNKTHIGTFYNDTITTQSKYYTTSADKLTGVYDNIEIDTYVPSNSSSNNSISNLTRYDSTKSVCQVVPNVFVDLSNHYLILQNAAGLTVYDRSNVQKYYNVVTENQIKTPSTIADSAGSQWAPWKILDTVGKVIILYCPLTSTKTLVAAMQYTSSSKTDVTLLNVCRFDEKGLVDKASGEPGMSQAIGIRNADSIDAYYRNLANNDRARDMFNNLDDYMLKTQIIPPVCPACPACPGQTACTNCGGQGGCGTLSQGGNTIVRGAQSPESYPRVVYNQSGNPNDNSVGGVLNNAVDTTGGIVNKTIDTAGDVVGGAAVGAGLLAGGVASGAGSLVGGAASGAGSIVGGAERAVGTVIGEAGDIASSAITGVSNILSSGQAQPENAGDLKNNNRNSYLKTPGTQNQYNDPYSYYGQLPAKGTNSFMPITADFSAFGK